MVATHPHDERTATPGRSMNSMLRILALLACFLVGCASPAQRIDREAMRNGLSREIATGAGFQHLIYMRAPSSTADSLTVFLEGDGIPWLGGMTPAVDPTTRQPVALRLMVQAPGPAMYVGRPCYHALRDPGCSPTLWTSARYSARIVDSMRVAIEVKMRELAVQRVRLVGYSGGGVLAILIAERLANVSDVVTIAANLDTDAWTSHHGYLPLQSSLNPARSEHPHPWRELHLQGALDTVVPPATTGAYFERFPSAQRRVLDNHAHACCWAEDPSAIWRDVASPSVSSDPAPSLAAPYRESR